MVSLGMSFGSININIVMGCVEIVISVKVFQGKTVSTVPTIELAFLIFNCFLVRP